MKCELKCEKYEIFETYDQEIINIKSAILPITFSALAINGALNGDIDHSICMFLTGMYVFQANKSLFLQRNKIFEEAPDGTIRNSQLISQNKEFIKNLVTFAGVGGLLSSGDLLKNENIVAAVVYGSLVSIVLYRCTKSQMGASKTFKLKENKTFKK